MQKLHFADIEQLGSLNDLIHDEYFELDDITYNKERGLVEIPFRRIFHGQQPLRIIRRKWFSRVGEVDVLRCFLRVGEVQHYEVIDKAKIGIDSFNTVEYVPVSNSLIFECCVGCELRLTVSRLSIEYVEVEYRGKARITYGLFWESNDGTVYE